MPKVATTPPDRNTQAGRLRLARESAGYTSIRDAAHARGWNENTYKSHEQGIRGKDGIKPKHLEKYARAFGVNLTWLTYGTGSHDAPNSDDDDPVELTKRLARALEKRGER